MVPAQAAVSETTRAVSMRGPERGPSRDSAHRTRHSRLNFSSISDPSAVRNEAAKQDRARVAGGQKHEVRYEAKKTGKSKSAAKSAVKKVGVSRKKVEQELCG